MNQHFDLITIGAGSGGVAASRRAAAHGARVAVVEYDRLGGTCVMRGCVPKKLLMYASEYADTIAMARAYGWSIGNASFDMRAWQTGKAAELDRLETIYHGLLVDSGVTVVRGRARVLGAGRVQVGDAVLSGDKLLIATGGSPMSGAIPGLPAAQNSDQVLDLPSVPRRIAVLGAGYIGMEFASIFARLGSEVRVFFRGAKPLTGFDADVQDAILNSLERRGIEFVAGAMPHRIEQSESGYSLHFGAGREEHFDAVFNAMGRRPNTAQLGLEAIGIALGASGAVPVNTYSETAVAKVYAVGDVTDRINLTPVAIAEGRAFADTVFGGMDVPIHHASVATAVFTTPPIGTIGMTEADAALRGSVAVFATAFRPMRTAFADRSDRIYMKLLVDETDDRVLGIHMVGADAPEIIQSLAVAMRAGVTKRQFDQTVAVHPTTAEEFVLLREPVRRLPARPC